MTARAPSWYAEAGRLRAQGLSPAAIATKLGQSNYAVVLALRHCHPQPPAHDDLDDAVIQVPAVDTVEPVSLNAQIAEVEYELQMRRKVYPRSRMRQSEAEEHMARMRAVLATLENIRSAK